MRVTPCCNMPFVGVTDMPEHNFFHINRVLLFLLRSNLVLRLLRHHFPLLLAMRQNRINGATMLCNCFMFLLIFLFPFLVHLKREEKPGFEYQIYQIERDKRQ